MPENDVIRICAITRKPKSASFQQRVQGYIQPLAERGIEVSCRHFPSGSSGKRDALAGLDSFDAVWWHRHLVHPLWLRRWRNAARRMVFDFDDPVCFTARNGGQRNVIRSFKFAQVIKRCDAVLAGSSYLQQLAARHCSTVHTIPMAVDIPKEPPRRRQSEYVELLWVGSPATQPYLDLIRAPLERLGAEAGRLRLRLVAHEPASFGSLEVDYRPWTEAAQNAGLLECHIGLCPMPDTPWTSGKCPYKVLQYQAWGMPWIGSAVGENLVVAGGDTDARGLCASDDASWYAALRRLIDDTELRAVMGDRGRAYVQRVHARSVVADALTSVWRDLVGRGA